MTRTLALIALAALLTACGAISGTTPPPAAPTRHPCVANQSWTDAEMDALAAALAPLPDVSPVWKLELDWQRMRDANRACERTNPEP